jgi:hypothetical protein
MLKKKDEKIEQSPLTNSSIMNINQYDNINDYDAHLVSVKFSYVLIFLGFFKQYGSQP